MHAGPGEGASSQQQPHTAAATDPYLFVAHSLAVAIARPQNAEDLGGGGNMVVNTAVLVDVNGNKLLKGYDGVPQHGHLHLPGPTTVHPPPRSHILRIHPSPRAPQRCAAAAAQVRYSSGNVRTISCASFRPAVGFCQDSHKGLR